MNRIDEPRGEFFMTLGLKRGTVKREPHDK